MARMVQWESMQVVGFVGNPAVECGLAAMFHSLVVRRAHRGEGDLLICIVLIHLYYCYLLSSWFVCVVNRTRTHYAALI